MAIVQIENYKKNIKHKLSIGPFKLRATHAFAINDRIRQNESTITEKYHV